MSGWSKTGKQINSQQGVKEDNETTGSHQPEKRTIINRGWTRKREGGGKPETTLIAGLD
jgi:hypothetical protein